MMKISLRAKMCSFLRGAERATILARAVFSSQAHRLQSVGPVRMIVIYENVKLLKFEASGEL